MKITELEFENIVDEFYERCKDQVYINGKKVTRKCLLEHGYDKKLPDYVSDVLVLNYRVEIVAGDLLQVAGRIRRPKGKAKESIKI